MDTTLIVPGLHGSGPDHWQSWFERRIPNCVRVVQSDWSDAQSAAVVGKAAPRAQSRFRPRVDRRP